MKPGDVVRLKSGGADMTIEQLWDRSIPSWTCTWWVPSTQKYESKAFPEDTLELVDRTQA